MEIMIEETENGFNLHKTLNTTQGTIGVIEKVKEDYPISVWNSPKVFKSAGIKGYEPMTAKELETEEEQDKCFNSDDYFIEEKFDGTRALVYFTKKGCRVFSRRVSKKTGFYVENSDSLPHIKTTAVPPDLEGTILDGEMFINGLPFKEVSSTLNCLWDKAVRRQIEKGFISFHAFDILFYNGIDLRNMRLEKRKKYLHLAVQQADNPYIEEVAYYSCGKDIIDTYLYAEVMKRINPIDEEFAVDSLKEIAREQYHELWRCFNRGEQDYLTPKAYYELIVALGGEGVIIKPKNGKYLHKRGWEYSKIKKFLTRDMILTGFTTPTREYTGKSIQSWEYWVDIRDKRLPVGKHFGEKNVFPVTKHYYYNLIGNMLLGVIVKKDTIQSMPKSKVGRLIPPSNFRLPFDEDYYVMEVCECSGFDDEQREQFTKFVDNLVGTVVEVKANEIFKDSGKLRHPRFLRLREDKNPEQCLWEYHINS